MALIVTKVSHREHRVRRAPRRVRLYRREAHDEQLRGPVANLAGRGGVVSLPEPDAYPLLARARHDEVAAIPLIEGRAVGGGLGHCCAAALVEVGVGVAVGGDDGAGSRTAVSTDGWKA